MVAGSLRERSARDRLLPFSLRSAIKGSIRAALRAVT
jgi:hypothetical protein